MSVFPPPLPPLPPLTTNTSQLQCDEEEKPGGNRNLPDKKTMDAHHTLTPYTLTHTHTRMHGSIVVGYLRSFFLHFCNIIYDQNHNQQRYEAEQQRAEHKRHG